MIQLGAKNPKGPVSNLAHGTEVRRLVLPPILKCMNLFSYIVNNFKIFYENYCIFHTHEMFPIALDNTSFFQQIYETIRKYI